MPTLPIRSILVASDLLPSSDAALASGAALAARLGAELHVLHALDIPTTGYPGLGIALEFQRRIHEARRTLREQVQRTLTDPAAVTSQQVRVETPQRAIESRAREVEAGLIILGPHRPRAFRGAILGNTADRVLRSAEVPVLMVAEPLVLPLRRVVAPIDLSDPARGALDQALLWSRALVDPGAPAPEVRVLHVIPRVYEAYDFPFDRSVIVPELQREIADALQRAGEGISLEVREEVLWGNAPADEIIAYAEANPTDLLVMGTHGYGALGRALIGSITSMVARATPCPVLMVPPSIWGTTPTEREVIVESVVAEPDLRSA